VKALSLKPAPSLFKKRKISKYWKAESNLLAPNGDFLLDGIRKLGKDFKKK
jgi:hypothetical protein